MVDDRMSGYRPRSYTVTTDASHNHETMSSVVNRDFGSKGTTVDWISDITYIGTWAGWFYLAEIIDLYSRRVVGWNMDHHMGKALVIEALEMAVGGPMIKTVAANTPAARTQAPCHEPSQGPGHRGS
jgi:transposase InsO family protein